MTRIVADTTSGLTPATASRHGIFLIPQRLFEKVVVCPLGR